MRLAEASAYLGTFLEEERKRIPPAWWDRLMGDGVAAIDPYFAEFVPRISLVQSLRLTIYPSTSWKAMERDHGAFRDFATEVYFDEAFRRSFPSLSWAVGRPRSVPRKVPVLSVAENLVREYERDRSRVATAVDSWRRFA